MAENQRGRAVTDGWKNGIFFCKCECGRRPPRSDGDFQSEKEEWPRGAYVARARRGAVDRRQVPHQVRFQETLWT